MTRYIKEGYPDSPDYQSRDLGDGRPVRVAKCSMCGISPSCIDDCGCFGEARCPYFGISPEKESKTPRTDAAYTECSKWLFGHQTVLKSFAEDLERELSEANAKLAAADAKIGVLVAKLREHRRILRDTSEFLSHLQHGEVCYQDDQTGCACGLAHVQDTSEQVLMADTPWTDALELQNDLMAEQVESLDEKLATATERYESAKDGWNEDRKKITSLQSGYEALQGRYDGLAAEMASKLSARDEHIRRLKKLLISYSDEDRQLIGQLKEQQQPFKPDAKRLKRLSDTASALAYDPEMGF